MYFQQFDKIPQLPYNLEQECYLAMTDDSNLTMADSDLGVQGEPEAVWGDHTELSDDKGIPMRGVIYKRYNVSESVARWVQENIHPEIPNNYQIGVQIFEHLYPGQPTAMCPHVDGPRGAYVLNYILDPGGRDVHTTWYQQQGHPILRLKEHREGLYLKNFIGLTKIHEVSCPVRAWHGIEIRVIHTITNLTSSRIALSVALTPQQWKEVMQRYN